MRKVLLLFFLSVVFKSYTQCPSPGDNILSSQEKVDAFVSAYSNCTTIEGNVEIIAGLVGTDDDGTIASAITDISGLFFLETINGDLKISAQLQDLNGFNNLITVNGNIEITSSNVLKSITGFNKLESTRSITIALNSNLTTVNGFNNVTRITNSLEIGNGLPQLNSISGFLKLKTLGGELNISKNSLLKSMPAFNLLETIGEDLNITSNPVLEEIIGFEKLTYIGNDLNIDSGRNIQGFQELQIIERFFDIRGNDIEQIPNFRLLENIGAAFRIENTSIQSFEGFDVLQRVGEKYFLEDWFIVSNNKSLNSVKGFGLFEKVEGDVKVQNNPLLSDCAWLCNLINNGAVSGSLTIQDNIGNCVNSIAVILLCKPDFDNDGIANVVDLDDDNDGILDSLEGNTLLDTDKDGYPDSLDLDSDGDECFDVIEAGFEDQNNDGILGDLPTIVDSSGRIINQNTGYVTPSDRNLNGIYDFQELNVLSPGKNNILQICSNAPKTDLFDVLLGNPDLGGIWSPSLSTGTSVFDPSVDKPGIYKYTHTDAICGDLSAEVKVEFPSNLSAGIDTEILICEGVVEIDLFNALNGNPSPNGFWSPQLKSKSNIYNKNLDTELKYNYILLDRFCGTLQASISIKNVDLPNSGISSKLQICEFSNEVNLMEVLNGEPDQGGTWSPTLPNGIFNPRDNSAGLYIYTVDNGQCGIASSSVDVQIIRNSELTNVTVRVNDFSSKNNSIEVLVNSTRKYEYSIDGIQYQNQNIFNDVSGGIQTIYVRGLDGCEFFSKEVFVKTFMTYFTPNNDGENDFWRLLDFPDVNYTIYIYNRFGNLLKKINSTVGFWDGTREGVLLNSNNYWFKVVTESGEIFNGNFSLLRK
jgi:gliding motility-associated-like protein